MRILKRVASNLRLLQDWRRRHDTSSPAPDKDQVTYVVPQLRCAPSLLPPPPRKAHGVIVAVCLPCVAALGHRIEVALI
jgi:hypothetical protein